MRKEYIIYAIDEIKKLLPDFEKKVLEANYGTDAWKEIKKIVVDMCGEKRMVYVNKDDLTKEAIQSLRMLLKEAREKQETIREQNAEEVVPEKEKEGSVISDNSNEFKLEPSPGFIKKSPAEERHITPPKESDSLPLFPDENDSPKDPGFPPKSFR